MVKVKLSCILLLMLLSGTLLCQTKSTNIQTIDGKKYYLHKTEKSQSLYAISKLYNVTLDELYAANPELKAGLKVHQEIKIPYVAGAEGMPTKTLGAGPATTFAIDTLKYKAHKIAKGETLYSITRKYNLTEKELSAYNPTLAEGLKEGQWIIVGEKAKRKPSGKENKENKDPKDTKTTVVPRDTKPSVILNKDIKPSSQSLVDSSLYKPVSKPRKSSYNIALILPFRLDATINMDLNEMIKNNGTFPLVPAQAIDFYLGFKRAVDSLITKECEFNLQVYDVDDKDTIKIIELAASSKFKELDFIVGPFYANGFKTIAKKAREFHIPIVSPVTRQNKILYNNQYISKTNPSQFTLLESLADYCLDSLRSKSANVILMSAFGADKKEQQFVNAFKKYYNEKIRSTNKSAKDTLLTAKGIEGLKKAYVPGVKNVVVSLSTNQVFIADFSTQLAIFADKKDIVLCGWQNLSEMDNIDQAYLNQLSFTFPHQYNLTNTAAYGYLNDEYRSLQGTLPGEYYYIGFDIADYYLKNLRDIGPDFVQTLNNLPHESNYSRFKFVRPDMTTGFDNRGVYIFRYENYQIQKAGWK